jgi:CRISPR-associated endonuclease/helicase Cas3
MWIKTLPVYSKLAPPATLPPALAQKMPAGWSLSQHQLETYQALVDPDGPEVIFNTAMTGDGKSLAGQLPTLADDGETHLFAMYPTNELIADQERQLKQTKQDWDLPMLRPALLNSAALDEMMEGDDFSQRGNALLNKLKSNDTILTNPDIFHYIMEHFYRTPQDAPDKIIGPLVDKYKQFTFDEFHIFEVPQVISVINALLFIREISGVYRSRALFLSATPGEEMLKFLGQAGMRYLEINPTRAGYYTHSNTPPNPAEWRQILQGSDIHFATGRVEEWLDAHQEDTLLDFFKRHRPGAKGAIIVNSIAAAKRILARLRPVFQGHGLTVHDNTGLTSREGRQLSYQADLLIGTSTVDVGVDFQINFLLFESRDAGTFLQRLGRLGRHDHYLRDGQQQIPFEAFEAHALVPPWVCESLFQGKEALPALLADEAETTRETLAEAIRAAYPPPVTFANYASEWGKFQSLNVIMNLNSRTVRAQYAQSRDRLAQQYQQTFGINIWQADKQRKELKAAEQLLLFEEALSFRGGSYFQCAILDETDEEMPGQPKLYNLLSLARSGALLSLEEDEFYRRVEPAVRRRFEAANGPDRGPLGYFRLVGWQDERREPAFTLTHDIDDWGKERFGQAIVLKGFELDMNLPGLTALNKRLKARHLPATLCLAAQHPLDLSRQLRLPLMFPLFKFKSLDYREGCVAFGREALLLHARLKYSKVDCSGSAAWIL